MLIRGKSSDNIADDIAYTLDVFPNHHRALVALMRLSDRLKTSQPPGARYTMDCYFQRAVRYAQTDEVARLLYANYLVQEKRFDDARSQLAQTEAIAGDNAFTHFNLGLVYLELKDYDKALAQAKEAQRLGLAKMELEEALRKVGRWPDNPASGASAASAFVSSAASAATLP
jgi:tetratricopeptide (TPR) repeat protein